MDNQANKEIVQIQKLWDECVRSKARADFKRIYLDLVSEEFSPPNITVFKLKLSPEARANLTAASYYPLHIKRADKEAPQVIVFAPQDVYIPITNSKEDFIFKITCALDKTPCTGEAPQFFLLPSKSFVRFDF